MKKIIIPTLLLFMIAACSTTTKSQKTKNSGWESLFDGKTTNGWHIYGQTGPNKFWKVEDGVLFPDAANKDKYGKGEGGDLVTDEEFGNFHLKMEWRISERGNSGILFHVKESPEYSLGYVTGPEMQVLDNGTPTRPGHPDGKIYTHRAGDLYDLLASKEVAKPQGEWNEVEIKYVDGKLDFYMNGVHTLSTRMDDQNWKDMVSISKFKNMPGFGKYNKGKIDLQFHNDMVWFRNIKIKRL